MKPFFYRFEKPPIFNANPFFIFLPFFSILAFSISPSRRIFSSWYPPEDGLQVIFAFFLKILLVRICFLILLIFFLLFLLILLLFLFTATTICTVLRVLYTALWLLHLWWVLSRLLGTVPSFQHGRSSCRGYGKSNQKSILYKIKSSTYNATRIYNEIADVKFSCWKTFAFKWCNKAVLSSGAGNQKTKLSDKSPANLG